MPATAESDPELTLEKLTTLQNTAESPDGVVRITMAGSRIRVKLHPMRLYSITDKTLGRDIAVAFERLIRDRNEAESAILSDVPAPIPDSPQRAAIRERVREGVHDLDVRVTSAGRMMRARWLGDVGLQVKFTSLRADRRARLETEIASTLEDICAAYHDAVAGIRARVRETGSHQKGH